MLDSTDVLVIGGGPAGLAAAIAARQLGFEVILADGSAPPIDKACGEGLMPDGHRALRKLGINIPAAEAHPFSGIRFLACGLSAEASFPYSACGLGVRRTTLHRLMVERARSLGVNFLWRTAVTSLEKRRSEATSLRQGSCFDVRMGSRTVRARWIVGADGGNSLVRRWAGLDRSQCTKRRFAFRQHFQVSPWTDRMEVYWGRSAQMYVAAVSDECVCVALTSHDPDLRLKDALQDFPELRARLGNAPAVSVERGAITATRTLKRAFRGNVALIGDASGTVDAITGEGLCLAFNQALVLAECLRSGHLERYQREHRRLSLRPRLMARLMLTMDRRSWLQRRALQVFRKRPDVFRRFLALHVGELSPLHIAADGLTLGWGLLTA